MRRGKDYLFVDSYNIINSWSELKKTMNEIGLDAAREEFIELMSEYQELSGYIIYLVFDAHLVKGGYGQQLVQKGVHIIYTVEHETADQWIEKNAFYILKKRDLATVASSDGLIQFTILGKGASRMSARELKEDYLRLKENMRRNIRRKELSTKKHEFRIEDLLSDELLKLEDQWKSKDP